jgi:hypothetical protein
MKRMIFKGNEIYSIDDLVRIYNGYNQGHFFDKDTMRFFKSKTTSTYESKDGVFYFVTSEKKSFYDETRTWTVRKAYVKGEKIQIDTVSDFCEFSSIARAKTALKNILAGK